jgi:ABC-type transport system involved in multi-copper enzyme maturation permease subunit
MKRALLFKELRCLRPFLFLAMALLLVDIIEKLLLPLEAQSFSRSLSDLPAELIFSQIALGFALGSGLLAREIDDGTLNFLDGLPLTRGAVFTAKIKAAMLVLGVYPLGLILFHVLLHLLARESLDHAVHPALLLTFLGLSGLVTAVGLTLGMLLGFLRSLSWLVLSLCVIGILLLKTSAPSLGAALNTADLLSLRFIGTRWQLPLATIWTQLGAALLFGALAFGLFKASGGTLARAPKWPRARRLLLVPAVGLMMAAAVAGLVILARQQASGSAANDTAKADAVEFAPGAGGHATTAHFSFSYPALSGERVKPLIEGADQTFADVAALLHMDGGAPIDVDLSGTTENHAGTAYLDRIRMHVRGVSSMDVLAHETAHVFATRLAGGESAQQLGGMLVFNEGLAQWVENALFSDGKASAAHELAAAIVSRRRLVAPRQLTDHDALAGAVDDNLKYPLGAALVGQFVLRYGPEAPKRLLQTLARADFPRDLSGYALWQSAFQLSGFDLDLVFDDYARHLKGLETKFARQIAALPRPRGSLVESDSYYAVTLRFDLPLPEDAHPMVRFRPGAASGTDQYRTRYIGFSKTAGSMLAQVPNDMVTRGEVCFQPGMFYAGIAVYEPWTCLPTSSAQPVKGDDI